MALEDVQDIIANNPWSVRAPGARPPGMSGPNDALANALRGIVTPRIAEGGRVTPIAPGHQKPIVPQGDSLRPAMGAPMTPVSTGGGGGGGGAGAGAITAGLGKIGSALSGGLEAIAAKQKAKQTDLAAAQAAGMNKPTDFLTPPAPAAAPAASGPLPTFTQPGVSGIVPDKTASSSGWPSVAEAQAYAEQIAAKNGIEPWRLSALIGKEYGGPTGPGSTGDQATSFGPLQLHYGGQPGVRAVNSHPGMGDDFTKATGLDARDPANWQATIDYATSQIPKQGWTPWATSQGKLGWGPREGIGAAPVQEAATPTPPARPADASAQDVIPGQQDPHAPGFDAGSVPYLGKQGMGPQDPTINPLAAALAGGQDQSQQLPNPALIAALLGDQGGFDVGGFFG